MVFVHPDPKWPIFYLIFLNQNHTALSKAVLSDFGLQGYEGDYYFTGQRFNPRTQHHKWVKLVLYFAPRGFSLGIVPGSTR